MKDFQRAALVAGVFWCVDVACPARRHGPALRCFHQLESSPLRFVDLQLGYYASDFLLSDRAAGKDPKQHLFVGLGLNLGELMFGRSTSGFGRAAYSVLDYVQVPYTSLRYDSTGRLGN
ncbi:hypothetical protein WSK_2939 [Novosphingobium sp. Rr 2-17]|uniref:hypothetical protein n=1 Tax=Novosphingobium sp. Rr 2-17 TaxID=555793 RepID=UPI000269A217|nr:hypothetical protein [Novosphingobium sp. Rr 2-17]EIZ78495.1 hypothetical protein WSK_2939 [Novosphingobium sp. Rr 2-17]